MSARYPKTSNLDKSNLTCKSLTVLLLLLIKAVILLRMSVSVNVSMLGISLGWTESKALPTASIAR